MPSPAGAPQDFHVVDRRPLCFGPTLGTDQRYETDRLEAFHLVLTVFPAGQAHERLPGLAFGHRHDEFGHPGFSWARKDGGMRSPWAVATMASSGRAGAPAERAVALDDVDSVTFSQRRSVARAWSASEGMRSMVRTSRAIWARTAPVYPDPGADLEDVLAALQTQCLGHGGNNIGLRDRLTLADRQGLVGVGEAAQIFLQTKASRATLRIASRTWGRARPARRSVRGPFCCVAQCMG